jgi:tmRNA-binding protein
MKPEQLYQNLIEIAEKLNVKVSEKNFRKIGINIQSGFCRVKNKNLFIIDKHLSVFKKNIILASFLNQMPLENIYIVPVVRDFVKKHRETGMEESFAD